MSQKITTSSLEFTDAQYLVGTVVYVMENNDLSLLMLHIWSSYTMFAFTLQN